MADNGEKTEQPTAKRRSDERKEGHVFQSKEAVTIVSLVVTFYCFKLLYSLTSSQILDSLQKTFDKIAKISVIDASEMSKIFSEGLITYGKAAMPMLLIAGLATIIPVIVQTKGLVSFKSIRPKFKNLNPISGMKKFFSLKSVVELLKSIIKITVLIYIVYSELKKNVPSFYKLIDMEITEVCAFTGSLFMSVFWKLIIAFIFIAAADYIYQKWEYEKSLKMTKQEVKEEFKNTEGDPQIKGKIKQKQREAAQRRMMQAVPEANVVIRNPTHYAVALKYEHGKNAAPIVVAKGKDNIALKIIDIADEHNVPIVENRPLARALYAEVELEHEIPSTYYQAVAEVIAFVYSLKEKELR